ncbi:hypothetical protein Dda_4207 [Drechslerella dactyloides]|uniref:Uncharacterized protein n=1 Tax=Drechslerella dactyloides TaxID=74499 RepID=A0AAD6J3S4_DREDA|nr:hypothetical protein Dda_4207 [Drechslerella dactyloides]
MPCKSHPPPYPALDSAADFLAFEMRMQIGLWEFRWRNSEKLEHQPGPWQRTSDKPETRPSNPNALIARIRRLNGTT